MSRAASHSSVCATDAALIGRLRNLDDHQSWDDFYRAYWKLIYRFACERGLNDAEAREVVQDTLLSVARSLHGFRPACEGGSFKRWLLCLTRRRAADHFRRRPRELPMRARSNAGTGGTGTAERVADPQCAQANDRWEREWEAQVLDAALEKLKRRVSPRHYQVFHLAVMKEQPTARVAETLGLNLAQVYLVKHRVLRDFKQMIKAFQPPFFDTDLECGDLCPL
jgi:RNA polymerase sigma-70 factor (ECF subfamily)